MAIRILFLGPLADLAGAQERDVAAPLDWAGLLTAVGPEVAEQLQQDRVKVAYTGKVLSDKATLSANDGDEIALLPPVSGG